VIKAVTVLRLASAAALSVPLFALAAGLGQMSVQSYLGQPLRVEIEIVSLQPGEENSLEARLASGNAFAQAGIEFSPALTGLLFNIERQEGRKPVLRVTSRQPVNEPFLDMLVELRWESGLLVREYTVLLDPPEYRAPKPAAFAPAPAAASPAAAPATEPSAVASEPSSSAPPGAMADAVKPEARAEERPISVAAPSGTRPAPAEARPATGATTYEVKKGDTLGAIARRYRPEGVTFNQMLIALQRANEDAFIRNNVNLVRAGRILNIPDSDTLAAVDTADANRLVIAQHADFAEYRSRLATAVAAAPSAPAPAERSAAGQITPKPEEPKPAAPKDQLKLSKADPKKPGAPAAKAAREDDQAARERALKEAQSRVTDLEKNVADLQKLMEIKQQQLAELERMSAKPAAAAPAPDPAAKAPEPPKPAPAPQAAKAPEAKPAAPPPAKPAAEPAKPVAEAPKPVAEAPKPPPAPVAAKPKPKPIAAPPTPEPSLMDEFTDNPVVALGGLGGVILLLGGYGAWAWQRKKKSAGSKFQDSVLGSASVAPAAAAAAGAAVAGAASSSQVSVSQSAVAGMDADDVDPIAEADVYMAYGRDAQAEEILKEALQKDANRVPVHVKLLEIYANRRDAKSFEQGALKLKNITNGSGPDWDKATALGRSVDPGNGLYGGSGGAPAAPAPAPAAAAPAPTVDFDIGGGAGGDAAAAPAPALDLDLGGGAPAGAEEKTDFSPSGTLIIDSNETKAASSGLDFDLGGASEKPADAGGGLNFELPAPAAEASASAPSAPAASGGGLDFDLNLGGSDAKAEAPAAPAMDLSEISLDLGMSAETPASGSGADPKWQEVATKLDLAKAYEEMGDKDGARELLNEVVREGDAAQQGQANQMLAKLG